MDKAQLEASGWKVGDASEFLALTPEETAYVELRLALSRSVRELRLNQRLTQNEVARLLGSSQSRLAKMESGDTSVSLDLLIRSIIALGASRTDLARMIAA